MVEAKTIVNFVTSIRSKNGHLILDSAKNQGRIFWAYLRLTDNLGLKVTTNRINRNLQNHNFANIWSRKISFEKDIFQPLIVIHKI